MLHVSHLRRHSENSVAVDDVSFTVDRGQLVGLLGPNGAGKTTTVSMIAALVTPEKGEVLVGGARLAGDTDPKKRKIGLVPQDLALYDELSCACQPPVLRCALRPLGRRARQGDRRRHGLVGLADRLTDLVKTYSGGMKRRLNLAAGLLHDPRHPAARRTDSRRRSAKPQRDLREPRTPEVARQSAPLHHPLHGRSRAPRDRIVVMDHGRVIADDTLAGLQSRVAVAGGKATLESVFLTLTGRSLRD
jgi:ABC-2 type transport system ATP-binding protein